MRVGDHRAVTDQDHPLDSKPLLDRVEHAGDRGRVGGVARVHLDRHGPALRGAHKPPVDLRLAVLAVAVMPQRGQRAAAPLHVGGGQVVEHKPAVVEVPAGERFFDPLLAGEQPVHRAEQLGLVDLAEVELVGERALREAPGQRQLGARRDQQLADHRDDHVALAAALPADQSLQIEPAQRAQHRGDVPVRQRAFDLEVLIEVDQHPSGEHRPDRLDDGQRQVREVAQVLVADLAALAVGAPQQVGRVLLPALALRLDCGYVSRAATRKEHQAADDVHLSRLGDGGSSAHRHKSAHASDQTSLSR